LNMSFVAIAISGGYRYSEEFNLDAFRRHARAPDPAILESLTRAEGLPGCVIDVGANGGQQAFAALSAGRRVYSVECLGTAYNHLLKAASHGVFPNVRNWTLLHACAGSNARISRLHLAFDSSSLLPGNVARGYESLKANWSAQRLGRAFEDVIVQPLDTLLSAEQVALVKVDTQGSEYDVLLGMSNILKKNLPVVQYECMGCVRADYKWFQESGNVMQLLQPLGYKCKMAAGAEQLNRVCEVEAGRKQLKKRTDEYTEESRRSLSEMRSFEGAWFSQTDREAVLRRVLRHQNPIDCASARYLILEDFEMQTGMGFSFLVLHTILLQAIWEKRVLIFASSALPSATWRWCGDRSRDFGCYFAQWSRCEPYLKSRNFTSLNNISTWAPSEQSLREQSVIIRQAHDRRRKAMWHIYYAWDSTTKAPLMGRAWWWSITYDVLLRLRSDTQNQAHALMAKHGVRPGDPMIVAVVRHGGKHHEEALIPVAEYEEPIASFTRSSCLNTTNVYVTTETRGVIKSFTAMCARRRWNCFWAPDPYRLDARHDVWNPRGYGDRALIHSDIVAHIGNISAINLAISQHARAIVGSLGSQWLKATLGFMRRFHNHSVSVCSLHFQPVGARSNQIFPDQDADYISDKCPKVFPRCF
ncbi:MAG: hypothetical protein SGPRY_014592, partial [Prymnesium sp.]